MVYQLLIKSSLDKTASGGAAQGKIMLNQQLAEEVHKPIIRKFEKQKVQSSFIDNIWATALTNMQLASKFKK